MDSSGDNLESELREFMKKQKMDKDEVEYVGLIKLAISCQEDIRAIQVCFYTLISLGVDQPGPQRSRL